MPRELLPLEIKLVIVLVGVLLRDLLRELHSHLVGVVPAKHITNPCNLRFHGYLNHDGHQIRAANGERTHRLVSQLLLREKGSIIVMGIVV